MIITCTIAWVFFVVLYYMQWTYTPSVTLVHNEHFGKHILYIFYIILYIAADKNARNVGS